MVAIAKIAAVRRPGRVGARELFFCLAALDIVNIDLFVPTEGEVLFVR
jgi:hypothetical protein